MGYENTNLADLVGEIKRASVLNAGDRRTNARIDELAQSINQLFLKAGRPGSAMVTADEVAERKDAIGFCHNRREDRRGRERQLHAVGGRDRRSVERAQGFAASVSPRRSAAA